MMRWMQKHKIRYPRIPGTRLTVGTILYPHDGVADGELQPTDTAEHRETGSCHMSVGQEKVKIQSMVSAECVSLSHHGEVVKPSVEP